MVRYYPNLSTNLKELMDQNGMNDSALSTEAEIQIYDIKKILSGDLMHLGFRRILKLSKVLDMPINELIDSLSQ